MPTYVGRQSVTAIIVSDGYVLMNLRDNKPEIWEPDRWSFIGGHVNEQETLLEALCREVQEETGMSLFRNMFEPLMNYHYSGVNTITTLFLYKENLLRDAVIQCNEGVETRWFPIEQVTSGFGLKASDTNRLHDVTPEHVDVLRWFERCIH